MSINNYTGDALKDGVLAVLGNFLILILAAKALGALARTEWGLMIALIIGGAVAALFVWMPDTAVAILKAIAGAISS